MGKNYIVIAVPHLDGQVAGPDDAVVQSDGVDDVGVSPHLDGSVVRPADDEMIESS